MGQRQSRTAAPEVPVIISRHAHSQASPGSAPGFAARARQSTRAQGARQAARRCYIHPFSATLPLV